MEGRGGEVWSFQRPSPPVPLRIGLQKLRRPGLRSLSLGGKQGMWERAERGWGSTWQETEHLEREQLKKNSENVLWTGTALSVGLPLQNALLDRCIWFQETPSSVECKE